MPHISLRVTKEEKDWMDSYAKLYGISLSDVIKNAFFEKMEDEFDLKVYDEHKKLKAKGLVKYHSHDDVKEMLGLSI